MIFDEIRLAVEEILVDEFGLDLKDLDLKFLSADQANEYIQSIGIFPIGQMNLDDKRLNVISSIKLTEKVKKKRRTKEVIKSLARCIFIDPSYITSVSVHTIDSPEVFQEQLILQLRAAVALNMIYTEKAIGRTRKEFDNIWNTYEQIALSELDVLDKRIKEFNKIGTLIS